jgi:hypothetical protein
MKKDMANLAGVGATTGDPDAAESPDIRAED